MQRLESGTAEASNAVRQDASRLDRLCCGEPNCNADAILAALSRDQVVLVQDASPEAADRLIADVARKLGLGHALEVQAAFASIHGHRRKVGQSFMTVSARDEYQFVSPHSEGKRSIKMELASFYCYENSTDGGENLFLNTDDASPAWDTLKETVVKVDLCGTTLSPAAAEAARMRYQINLPADLLHDDDEVVGERPSPVSDIRVFNVLRPSRKSFSRILGRYVNTYWDNVASTDLAGFDEFVALLQDLSLLRIPSAAGDLKSLDCFRDRRVWRSDIKYRSLFKAMIVRKLAPGEMIIQNNLTWAHAASNWTPGSGIRKVVAAFA